MRHESRRGMLTAISGVGAWIVPAWGCPVCLSAFAGTMSALGLGFVASKAVLTPLTGAFLAVALFALGFGARSRRTYGPLALGIAAAGVLVGSKFWPDTPWIGYVGLSALLAACVWNVRATPRPIESQSLDAKTSSVG